MSNKKFNRYFEKSLVNEALGQVETGPPMEVGDVDAEAFASSFEDDTNATQIDSEIENAGIPPEQRADLLKLADRYAEHINTSVLPTLRKLHNAIVIGTFSTIAPDVKGISGINEDLAKLAESLRGRTRDAVLKAEQNEGI